MGNAFGKRCPCSLNRLLGDCRRLLAVAKVTLAIDREPDEIAEWDDRHEETWKRYS